MKMNIQNLMKEAQKMQAELQKTTEELNKTEYVGSSALVSVKINGKKEILEVKINNKDDLEKDDLEMLEDMIIVALNDAMKKADSEKEQKLSKYGQGLTGLM